MPTPIDQLRSDGFAVIPQALPEDERQRLLAEVEGLPAHLDADARGGYRDLFTLLPSVRSLAGHPALKQWPSALLGPHVFAVRAILFDKTPSANWKVAWHQDLTIPVKERRDVAGFGSWSEKAGILHVQPPTAVLERMLTVRLHLDPCETWNGPVRLLPGTHRQGRLSGEMIDRFKASILPVETICPAGGLLLMHPLALHASSPATRPGHRRVIHLEYAAEALPGGLEWQEQWPPSSSTAHTAPGSR
jgi:ectoine hydroxylase-related dioxygenase (phytanoyl-CoA dioxygenase family)